MLVLIVAIRAVFHRSDSEKWRQQRMRLNFELSQSETVFDAQLPRDGSAHGRIALFEVAFCVDREVEYVLYGLPHLLQILAGNPHIAFQPLNFQYQRLFKILEFIECPQLRILKPLVQEVRLPAFGAGKRADQRIDGIVPHATLVIVPLLRGLQAPFHHPWLDRDHIQKAGDLRFDPFLGNAMFGTPPAPVGAVVVHIAPSCAGRWIALDLRIGSDPAAAKPASHDTCEVEFPAELNLDLGSRLNH